MKLNELKQGMICKLRNNESITVINYGYFSTIDFNMFNLETKYNDDFTHRENKQLDIMEITYGNEVVFKRNESRWFVPGVREEYYLIKTIGEVRSFINTQSELDEDIFNNQRVFKTQEEAEKRLRQQQATLSVERWIAENDVEVDVKDINVLKCSLCYDDEAEEFEVMSTHYYIYAPKQFILSSQEKAKQLIEEREKELKIMLGVEE